MEVKDVFMPSVRLTYNEIAHSFDKTRYSIWKAVRDFYETIPEEALIADIGCGNGKNMIRPEFCFGCDITEEFVKICSEKGLKCRLGDILDIPFPDNQFDATLCIAVLHHLDTKEKMIRGIQELLRITKSGGRILITVWAYEQKKGFKYKFMRGDNLVPWQLDGKTIMRYYYIFVKDELDDLVKTADSNIIIESSFYDCGNWNIIIRKK